MFTSGVSLLKKHVLVQSYEEFYKDAKTKFDFKMYDAKVKDRVSSEDWSVLGDASMGLLGRGVLVQHKKMKTQFVMKLFNKDRVLKEKNAGILLKEKKILEACRFPFILELAHCTQDRETVYLLYSLHRSENLELRGVKIRFDQMLIIIILS